MKDKIHFLPRITLINTDKKQKTKTEDRYQSILMLYVFALHLEQLEKLLRGSVTRINTDKDSLPGNAVVLPRVLMGRHVTTLLPEQIVPISAGRAI
jgi:hypothetical protein